MWNNTIYLPRSSEGQTIIRAWERYFLCPFKLQELSHCANLSLHESRNIQSKNEAGSLYLNGR